MEEIFLQTKAMDDDTLALVGNAWKEEMVRREKERLVYERYGKITEHDQKKNNKIVHYYMVYDGRKQIRNYTSRDALIEELFSRIEGEAPKAITVEQLFEMYA